MTEPDQEVHEQPAEDQRPVSLSKILVPTDFSATSELALGYAVALAKRFDAYIFLMHVLTAVDDFGHAEHSSPAYQAQRQTAERSVEKILASRQLRDVPHEVLLEDGYLWPTIEQFIHGNEVDLVAVGTRGAPSANRQFLGSSAEMIFRNVDCPVLTVGPACHRAVGQGPPTQEPLFQKILFATDFGRAAGHATRYALALALALAFRAELTLLHVVDAVPCNDEESEILRETSRIRLIEAVPEEIAPRLRMETEVEFGDAPEQILKVARARHAELIVMGARAGRTLATHHLPETSAYTVAAGASCPLMTVRR